MQGKLFSAIRISFIRNVLHDVRHRKSFVDIINSARRRALRQTFSSGIFSEGSSLGTRMREHKRNRGVAMVTPLSFRKLHRTPFKSIVSFERVIPSFSQRSRLVVEKSLVNYLSSSWHASWFIQAGRPESVNYCHHCCPLSLEKTERESRDPNSL